MVADTVKGFHAYPPLFAQQDDYSSSPSPSLMTQTFTSSSRQRMDMPSLTSGIPSITSVGLMTGTGNTQRKSREFTPESKKDNCYWDRRRRNNEAAKRSREKRKVSDMMLEQKVVELSKENHMLKAKISAYESKFNVKSDFLVNENDVSHSIPAAEEILSIARRTNFEIMQLAQKSQYPDSTTLLSPNSLSGSPPSQMRTNSISQLYEEENYPAPVSFIENREAQAAPYHSPERDESLKRGYSPEPQFIHQNRYISADSSGALNLSSRSRSPLQMDCSEDNSKPIEYSALSKHTYLPHKLRHKNRPTQSISPPVSSTSTVQHRHFSHSNFPSNEVLAYSSIKTEAGESSPPESNSSDDSGIAISPHRAHEYDHLSIREEHNFNMNNYKLDDESLMHRGLRISRR